MPPLSRFISPIADNTVFEHYRPIAEGFPRRFHLVVCVALSGYRDAGTNRMSSSFFEKCVCGLEFKIIRMLNDYKQTYTCECGKEIHITGTVLDIHYRKADQAGKLADWLQAPAWRIRDSR